MAKLHCCIQTELIKFCQIQEWWQCVVHKSRQKRAFSQWHKVSNTICVILTACHLQQCLMNDIVR